MLGTLRYAPSLHHSHRTADLTGRCSPSTIASSWPTLTALRMMGDALREGLAASREYEHLRSRGFSHDAALREALGLGRSPHGERETAKPLYFAGRA
jgi:hypothetical protein